MINIPDELVKDKIIDFKFEELELRFKIIAVKKITKDNRIIDYIDLAHIYKDTIDTHTEKFYQNIPISLLSTSLKSRVILTRRSLQKWLFDNKEELIRKLGEEKVEEYLKTSGVFTSKEIDNLIKGIIETSISINEYKLQKKLKEFAEIGKPPIDYENEFKPQIENLIGIIDKSTLTAEQKVSAYDSVIQILLQGIIGVLKKIGFSEKLEWIDELKSGIDTKKAQASKFIDASDRFAKSGQESQIEYGKVSNF